MKAILKILFVVLCFVPQAFAQDVADPTLFWTETDSQTVSILRFALDGSSQQTAVLQFDNTEFPTGNFSVALGVVSNPAEQKLYFSRLLYTGATTYDHVIQSVDYDGTNLETVLTVASGQDATAVTDLLDAYGTGLPEIIPNSNMFLCSNLNKIFWIDIGEESISSANLDGTEVTTIKDSRFGIGDLFVDCFDSTPQIYWSENTSQTINDNQGSIFMANADGTGNDTLVHQKDDAIFYSIAVDPESENVIYSQVDSFFTEVGSFTNSEIRNSVRVFNPSDDSDLLVNGLTNRNGVKLDDIIFDNDSEVEFSAKFYFTETGAAQTLGVHVAEHVFSSEPSIRQHNIGIPGASVFTRQFGRPYVNGLTLVHPPAVLMLETSGSGDGSVTIDLAPGQSCDSDRDTDDDCTFEFERDTFVVVTATAAEGSEARGFTEESNPGCAEGLVRMDSNNILCDAVFDDVLAPVAPSILTPEESDIVTDGTPEFTGTGVSGDTVQLFEDTTLLGSAIVDSNGSWALELAKGDLAFGERTVRAVQLDSALNTSSADEVTFTLAALITGRVTLPNGDPLAGVLVTVVTSNSLSPFAEGFTTAITDENGFFEIAAPDDETEVTLQASLQGTVIGTFTVIGKTVADEGEEEEEDDEDSGDTPSGDVGVIIAEPELSQSAQFLWNGFLRMANVVGVTNNESTELNGTVRMLDVDGMELGSASVSIPPFAEVDLLVNLLQGFSLDSVGTLRLEFPRNGFSGSGFYYRFGDDNTADVEFEMGLGFDNPVTGTSYALFNTFQPSKNLADASNLVTNWLALINIDSTATRTFTVEAYDQAGNLITTITQSVPPRGRRDIEAGHEFSGPSSVGLLKIIPENDSVEYSAVLSRYGADAPATVLDAGFDFATTIRAQPAATFTKWIPISTGGNADTWVATANTASTEARVELTYFRGDGTVIDTLELAMPANAQLHTRVNDFLPVGATGALRVRSLNGAPVVTESVSYYFDTELSILSAYASQAEAVTGTTKFGSYNLFLGQSNFLRLFNVSETQQTIGVTLNSADGTALGNKDVIIGAKHGLDIGLETFEFAPPANSIGTLSISTAEAGVVLSEVVRVKPREDGTLDAVETTPVR